MRQINLDNVNGVYWYDADGMVVSDFIPSLMTYMTRAQKTERITRGTSVVFITNANLVCDFDENIFIKNVKKYKKDKAFHIVFVRGTMTPSQFFTDDCKLFDKLSGFVHFAPDYSITTLNTVYGENYNVLAIGGGITPERSWKMKHGNRKSKSIKYLEDEMPILDDSIVANIIKSGISIDVVISNYAPSFMCKAPYGVIEKWSLKDDKLESDYRRLFEHFDFLYKEICDKCNDIKVWIFPSADKNIVSLPSTIFITRDMKDDDHNIINYISAKRSSTYRRTPHSSLFDLINEEKCIEDAQIAGDGHNGRLQRGAGLAGIFDHHALNGPRVTVEPLHHITMPWNADDEPFEEVEDAINDEAVEPEDDVPTTQYTTSVTFTAPPTYDEPIQINNRRDVGGSAVLSGNSVYFDYNPYRSNITDNISAPDASLSMGEASNSTSATLSDRVNSMMERLSAYTIEHP